MTYRWRVTIKRWPYSGVDQKLSGEEISTFEVEAETLQEAAKRATLYQNGVQSSPHVWEAPLTKIEQI